MGKRDYYITVILMGIFIALSILSGELTLKKLTGEPGKKVMEMQLSKK